MKQSWYNELNLQVGEQADLGISDGSIIIEVGAESSVLESKNNSETREKVLIVINKVWKNICYFVILVER